MLVDARVLSSQIDVGKNRRKFHVTLKPNVDLKRQLHSKVSLHLKDKLEKLLTQQKDADIIQETDDDEEMGSLNVKPNILMPKNDSGKLVIEARYFNSVTDLSSYSWPLEQAQTIMTKFNGKFFSMSDLSCVYHQVTLSWETQKLISFKNCGGQHNYPRGFYRLCRLPIFFSQIMTRHFDPLIKKKQAITETDTAITQSQNENEVVFTVIR